MTAATDQGGPAFEGWAVLEVMGHRRLAGFVREVTVAGTGMLRIDVPSYCEGGEAAVWCPEHGSCSCKHGPPQDGPVESSDCPLHSASSRHGEEGCEVHATQFYSPAALYCLTPTTATEARRVAHQTRPAPYVRYERPKLPALKSAPQADGDDGKTAPGTCARCEHPVDDCDCCGDCGQPPSENCLPGCPQREDDELGEAGA